MHDFLADTRVIVVQEIGSARRFVVIAIGVLPFILAAAIFAAFSLLSKTADLVRKSIEDETRRELRFLRSVEGFYYSDTGDTHPPDLAYLTLTGKYLARIPTVKTGHHDKTNEVQIYMGEVCANYGQLRDTGRWGYVADPNAPCNGKIFVDCTHTDSRGKSWHSY